MINYKKEFEKFLNEHEALEQFWQYNELTKNNFTYDTRSIQGAFVWRHTPEGVCYWKNLNALWYERLEQLANSEFDDSIPF